MDKNKNINQLLKEEKLRYRKNIYLVTGILSVLIVISYFFLILSKGTKIIIYPEEARNTAKIVPDNFLDIGYGHFIYSFSQSPSFRVLAKDFKELKTILPKEKKGISFEVTLEELPALINLSIKNKLTDTKWFINGEFFRTGENIFKEVLPGDYEILIDHPLHKKQIIKKTIKRNEKFVESIFLEELNAILNIKTTPAGSEVFVNMKKIGSTPLIYKIKGGEHKIKVKKKSYQVIEENILISNKNLINDRNYILKKIKSSITINAFPANGKLLINNILYDHRKKIDLSSETKYQLLYSKKGYEDYKETFKLKPNETRSVQFNLKKEFGNVDFISNPIAEVWINNILVGTTPLTKKLQTFEQEIMIKKKEYRTQRQKIVPDKISKKIININLIKEATAKLQESKLQFTNELGINFKLFNPKNDITKLGSERYERGQRANESSRTVKLSKPFYVSTYEITNMQFSKYNNKNIDSNKSNFPVNNISWLEAVKFCNWLSIKEGLPKFYNIEGEKLKSFNHESNGYRLLTEAEWEWLARKANKKKITYFSWGDSFIIPDNFMNIADESSRSSQKDYIKDYNDNYEKIAPVGSFDMEQSGLYDLSGNLSEWTHDYYSVTFKKEILNDPLGKSDGNSHVVKGANWSSGTLTKIRPSYRENAINGSDKIGFRIGRYL